MLMMPLAIVAQEHDSPGYFQQQLELANDNRTSNREIFNRIVAELSLEKDKLSVEQLLFLTYLKGYQKVISGDLEAGSTLLDIVIEQDTFPSLKHRAITTKVSAFTYTENLQRGFTALLTLLSMLDEIQRINRKRYQAALFSIAMFYNRLSQYRISQTYVNKLLVSTPSPRHKCLSSMLQVESALQLKQLTWENINDNNVADCELNQEYIASGTIHSYIAKWYIQKNRPDLALSLLESNLEETKNTQYYHLISDFYSLIAQAYFDLGSYSLAIESALKADESPQNKD